MNGVYFFAIILVLPLIYKKNCKNDRYEFLVFFSIVYNFTRGNFTKFRLVSVGVSY
jgi:hypothetical protein